MHYTVLGFFFFLTWVLATCFGMCMWLVFTQRSCRRVKQKSDLKFVYST